MNQILGSQQWAIEGVGEISGHLLHPGFIRMIADPAKHNLTSLELDEEPSRRRDGPRSHRTAGSDQRERQLQDVEAPAERVDSEEVSSPDDGPVLVNELGPGPFAACLGLWG